MSLSQSPSETSTIPEIKQLSSEALTHVDNVVKQVNDIFDANPEEKEVVYEALKNLLSMIIFKSPGKLADILDQVDNRYQKRLEGFGYKTYERRKEAIGNYTKFLTEMGDTITLKAQNTQWQDEQKNTMNQYNTKKDSLIKTYKNILEDLKPTK